MAKVTLNNITSGFASNTLYNANNTALTAAIDNTLSRDGTGPNQMGSNLDMNGYMIINQSNPITVSGLIWEGPWITAQLYHVGDIVQNSGSAYICIVQHTSGVFATDFAALKWQLFTAANFPDQTGNNGKYLKTDGANTSWGLAIEETAVTGSARLPVGTTAQRDAIPTSGYFRFNSTYGKPEIYNGTSWSGLGGATGSGGDDIFYENGQTVTTDYTITTGKNAVSAGPISIATGITVTIPTGSTWSIV